MQLTSDSFYDGCDLSFECRFRRLQADRLPKTLE